MEIVYKCHWPGCTYHTHNRNEIEYHHIIPKELGNRLNSQVVLSFCPTHHRLIWHPECKNGHHSINGPTKLQIHNIYPTSDINGYAVEYETYYGNVFYEFFTGDYREPKSIIVQPGLNLPD